MKILELRRVVVWVAIAVMLLVLVLARVANGGTYNWEDGVGSPQGAGQICAMYPNRVVGPFQIGNYKFICYFGYPIKVY